MNHASGAYEHFRRWAATLLEHQRAASGRDDEVCDAAVRGEPVKLSSFGSFVVRKKGQRVGRNPKTGKEVPISPRRVMVFKPSAILKQRINSEPDGGQ